jgi:E3 SUMO-protein ligase PIAS1
MNQSRPKWECPVCNSKIAFTELIFDGYFEDILKNTNDDCDQVQILEKGEWTLPKAKVIIETASSSHNTNGKRDLIILDDSPEKNKRII